MTTPEAYADAKTIILGIALLCRLPAPVWLDGFVAVCKHDGTCKGDASAGRHANVVDDVAHGGFVLCACCHYAFGFRARRGRCRSGARVAAPQGNAELHAMAVAE
jgi:hypothetical protein